MFVVFFQENYIYITNVYTLIGWLLLRRYVFYVVASLLPLLLQVTLTLIEMQLFSCCKILTMKFGLTTTFYVFCLNVFIRTSEYSYIVMKCEDLYTKAFDLVWSLKLFNMS